MKSRHVRMSVTHITARSAHHLFTVINLSLSGALLEVQQEPPFDALVLPAVDSLVKLVLIRASVDIALDAQVIRSDMSTYSPTWLVAVKFLNVSRLAKSKIPQLLVDGRR
jgi:hypothetical protein